MGAMAYDMVNQEKDWVASPFKNFFKRLEEASHLIACKSLFAISDSSHVSPLRK